MYGPIGYYLNCDDAVCADHLPEEWAGFEDWPGPLAIFSDSESDTPTHCVECRALIPHALTSEGHRYVSDALEDGSGDPAILKAWHDYYGAEGCAHCAAGEMYEHDYERAES